MTEHETIPAAARLLRDFVNTREPQVDAESLTTPERLRDWLAAHQLLPAGTRLSAEHVGTAIALREGVRALLLDHAGHSGDPEAIAAYNTALADVPLRMAFDDTAHRLVSADDAPAARAMAHIIEAIRQCERDDTWHRLKACARDTCRWAFYDASRNQSRRWCSMAGCGNHIKMKRAYATRRNRQLAAAAPQTSLPRRATADGE
jgi:predicted RNA-binding Zn ribbon-like protein